MRSFKRALMAAAVAVVAVAGTAVMAPPASANDGSILLYGGQNLTNSIGFFDTFKDVPDFRVIHIDNQLRSLRNDSDRNYCFYTDYNFKGSEYTFWSDTTNPPKWLAFGPPFDRNFSSARPC
jgi:hypothetical protein